MHAAASEIATNTAGTAAGRPLSRSPRRFLLDRRFREGKRVQDLVDVYTAALGGPAAVDAVKATKVLSAAMARALYEATAGARLRGDDVSYEDIVRVGNQADRTERALGLAAGASAGSPSSPGPFAALLDEMGARRGEVSECVGGQVLAQGAAPSVADAHSAADVSAPTTDGGEHG
jgi:hypothetical protein